MGKIYYLPISSTSLAHYFGCACIKPSKYFENKQEDLQDKFSDFLLVTTHFGTQQTDCCIELVFTTQETEDLIDIKDGFFLYEKPLPITRAKRIHFTSKERQEQTITNINISTAFVPNELAEITQKSFDTVSTDKLKKPQDIHIVSYSEELKRLDGFLGGLALMRLAGEDYMNYSENYFATLSLFNSAIQRDLENSKVNIDTRYHGAFTGDSGFQKIIPYLNKTINETDIDSIAKEENQQVKKNYLKIIDLDSLDKNTYIVAILNTYGVGNESKKKKIDELILSNFKSDIKSGKSEGIALCYGINRGYSAFSNKYSSGKNEKVVKFQLNSQLDYYTIESLYQYVFNNNAKSDEFAYLNWCPKQKWTKISKTNYKILDVAVIGKKKARVLSKEYFQNLFPSSFQSLLEKTLLQICQELVETVFNDTKNEIADKYENQIAQLQEENVRLQEEIDKLKTEQQKIQKSYPQQEEVIPIVAEPITPYSQKQEAKKIAEKVLKYKDKPKKMLEDEARKNNISIPKRSTVNDIILSLIAPPDDKPRLL
jgi:hypothetical protein